MQFINNQRGRSFTVNTGINKTVTVLPGQLIDLPMADGLEIGLTPVDDFRLTEQVKTKQMPASTPPGDEQLFGRLDAALEAKFSSLEARLLDPLTGTGAIAARLLDALNNMPFTSAPAVEGTTGKDPYIPLEESYRDKKIEADTSGLKVEKAAAAADRDAADELDALLDIKDEK